jgi:hypothetical protein
MMNTSRFLPALACLSIFILAVPTMAGQKADSKTAQKNTHKSNARVNKSATRTGQYLNHSSKNINHWLNGTSKKINKGTNKGSKEINHAFQGKKDK